MEVSLERQYHLDLQHYPQLVVLLFLQPQLPHFELKFLINVKHILTYYLCNI